MQSSALVSYSIKPRRRGEGGGALSPSSREPSFRRHRRRGRGGGAKRVYRQTHAERALPSVPVKEIASFVVPAGAFIAITFVLWKVVEKVFVPKPRGLTSIDNKSSLPGIKWSFAPGTNLLGNSLKIERKSAQKLNEFAKELRLFRSVDMSGSWSW